MKIVCVPIFASIVAASLPVAAQTSQATVTTAPGSGRAVQTSKTSATVVGIVPSTRTVSLKRPDGKVVDIHVGDEVRNFDKIRVGDRVNVEYTQALSLDLKKGGAGAAKVAESAQIERAPAGAQPAATVGTKVTVLADVLSVDAKRHVVTLRGPQGNVIDLNVQDPEQLKRVKPGDQVQAVYAESMAISVEPAAATSKK
jgi:translation initiation factor IF-1/Cu/Ag efflux protein CusF